MKQVRSFLMIAGLFGLISCSPRLDVAPDFTLPYLLFSSPPMTLSEEIKESPVLLVFWTTWCPTCVSEISSLNRFYEKAAQQGVRMFAINIQESRAAVEKFASAHTIRYPVLLDESGEVSEKYKVNALPTMILLAKGGKILYYGFRIPENYLEKLNSI